ncbi:MAG: DNA primase [Solobacterium sp.]|nr:DNA primase [Solobacterium sp.]
MVRISEEEINAVRQRADIVDIVGHYLQIHRQGKAYKAVCPFHDDHSPSLNLNPDRQIYKCFVCGAGGNVFTFVQNYEKISFPAAVGRVASLVGYPLSVEPEAAVKKEDPHREKLYQVMNESIRYMMYQIDTQDAAHEKEYLEKRGMNADVRNAFQIGYNPPADSLYRFLHAKGYDDRDIVSCNLGRMTESGMHDVFSGRIAFPIHDTAGNPIGFSARTLDPSNPSKYINTTETELFTKGDIVYNYHRAKMAARREGRVYVCEGVTDVIALYRAGIQNAVCTLGTSCTENQIRLLRNMAAKTVFCYDGDNAGQAATYRAAGMLRKEGCEVLIVQNKTGLDPDEILRNQGAEALRTMLKQEITWMEFVLSYFESRTNLNSYLEKKEMAEKVMSEISQLQDDIDRRYFTEKLSALTGFHLETAPVKPKETARPLNSVTIVSGTQKAEEMILKQIMNSTQAARKFEEELGFLTDSIRQRTALIILDAVHRSGKADPSSLMDEADDQNVRNLISKLAYEDPEPYDEKIMAGAIRRVKIESLTKEADAYKQQLKADLNQETRELILNRYSACIRELRRYIDEEKDN